MRGRRAAMIRNRGHLLEVEALGRLPFRLAASALAAIAGCVGPVSPSADNIDRIQPEWVTPEIGAHLVAGRLENIDPAPEYPGEVSKAQALDILSAHLNLIGTSNNPIRPFLEEGFGGSIDFAVLTLCDRAFYLRSSFEQLPATQGGMVLGLSVGGSWFATYCVPGDRPAVVEQLSASTKLRAVDGRLVFPRNGTTDVLVTPIGPAKPRFPGPEKAVELVFKATGKRISAIPYIVKDVESAGVTGPPHDNRPLGSFWRIEIEEPTEYLDSQSSVRSTKELYVPFAHQVFRSQELYVTNDPPLPPFTITLKLHGGDEDVLLTPRWAVNLIRFHGPPATASATQPR